MRLAFPAASLVIPAVITAQTPPPARALRESLLAQDRAMAAAIRHDGFAAGVASALAPDALLLLDEVPVAYGREAAARALAARPDLAGMMVERQPLIAWVAADGTLGIVAGGTRARRTADTLSAMSNYLSVWRRQGDGWTLVAHVESGLPREGTGPALDLPALPRTAIAAGAAAFATADNDFARLARDSGAAAAFGAFAAPTAVTFGPAGELIVGAATIRARLAERRVRSDWAWAPVAAGASDDGELGFTVGESAITVAGDGGPTTFYGHYLTAWRRMPDGTIRFLGDAGSSRPAPRSPQGR